MDAVTLETVLFFVTIVFDEIRAKVLCTHTKLIIVCRVCCGSKNSKNVLFCSTELTNQNNVILFYLLLVLFFEFYCQSSLP